VPIPVQGRKQVKKDAVPWLCECVCRSGLELGVGGGKKRKKDAIWFFFVFYGLGTWHLDVGHRSDEHDSFGCARWISGAVARSCRPSHFSAFRTSAQPEIAWVQSRGSAGGTEMWGAWRGFGLGVAVLRVVAGLPNQADVRECSQERKHERVSGLRKGEA
jgi:hypothetical protein